VECVKITGADAGTVADNQDKFAAREKGVQYYSGRFSEKLREM
jgi:hypothetical protein